MKSPLVALGMMAVGGVLLCVIAVRSAGTDSTAALGRSWAVSAAHAAIGWQPAGVYPLDAGGWRGASSWSPLLAGAILVFLGLDLRRGHGRIRG